MALTVSDELARLASACRRPPVTFRSLLGAMTPREHAILTLFLGLCFLHPFPMPGISTVIGAIIAIAGARMARGLGPWIPHRWMDHHLPGDTLARVLDKAALVALRLEKGKAEPQAWLGRAEIRAFNGALVSLCGLLIMLPLPPPTNFPPALALVLMSMGILRQRPGWLAAGYAAVAVNLLLLGALVAGAAGVTKRLPF